MSTGRIVVNQQLARPAMNLFTWRADLGDEWYRLVNIERLFAEARRDGVPDDAQVQLSDVLYLYWKRPASITSRPRRR